MSSEDQSVHVCYEIPALAFATTLGFSSESSYQLAERFLFGRISGARLPPIRHSRVASAAEPTVWIDLEPTDEGKAQVAFRGVVDSPRYEVELAGFHWDFSKVINSLVMEAAVETSLIPVHAACLGAGDGVVLLPGASGAGKSSIAYAALTQGVPVHSSELAFVQDGRLVCGNSALTIDRAALELFGMPPPPSSSAIDGPRFSVDLAPLGGQPEISRLVFPQVHPGKMQVRSITSRRARMLLFENVVTQLPLVQLLAQETWPIWRPPPRDLVERVMEQVTELSVLDPVIVYGNPREIAVAVGGDDPTSSGRVEH